MPIYLDAHTLPGVTAKDVAEAHQQDLIYQAEFGCNCLTYWFDEGRNSAFCLIEAPEKDAVNKLHKKSHGLLPNKVIEVSSSVVNSFLGRIQDPENVAIAENGMKVFSDSSFRALLILQTKDPILLQHELGREKAAEIIRDYYGLVRKHIAGHEGIEAENGRDGMIASFKLANNALTCALAILNEAKGAGQLGLRLSINGGNPVESSNDIFGSTRQFATQLCSITDHLHVALSSNIKELLPYELFQDKRSLLLHFSPSDEGFLGLLFSVLEKYWPETESGITDYCRHAGMSQSGFYRKVTALTGLSFNALLQGYRLDKAREQLNKQQYSISQITFASGFSSPSYFTKLFKKKYGLLPKDYSNLVHLTAHFNHHV